MNRKRLNAGVVVVGIFAAGIGIGRFCFLPPSSPTVLSPTDNSGMRAKSPKAREDQSARAIAKSANGGYDVKHSAPESAPERLAKFMAGNPNIDERSDFVKKLITELCSQGRDEEAYALIDKNSGQLRDVGMFSFYSSASLDKNQLMAKLKREAFGDILPTFHRYMRGIGIDQLKAEAESSRLADFWRERGAEMPSDLITTAITEALRSNLTDAGRPESLKTLKLASDLAENGTIKTYQIYELVGKDKNLNPFEKWDFLKQIDPKDVKKGDEMVKIKTREKLIYSMIKADGSKAMGDILNNQTAGQASDVNTAVRVWNQVDSAGVVNWYQQNQSTLSPDGRAMVATTLSTIAAEFGEFESARQWASQIQDPARKVEAMKMVDEKAVNYQKWLERKQ